MTSNDSIWFHIGRALEHARQGATTEQGSPDRRPARSSTPKVRKGSRTPSPRSDDLLDAGIALVADRLLGATGKGRRPGVVGLVRAGASGAAAGLVVELLRPLLRGSFDRPTLDQGTIDRLISGASQGLVYGALIAPRVPGPPLLKGALYGSIEYAADPIGGLSGLLAPHTPQAKLPVLRDVMGDVDPGKRVFLEHLAFGVALALLYDAGRASSGTSDAG